jgi:phospholipid transport system substrate-binding protein
MQRFSLPGCETSIGGVAWRLAERSLSALQAGVVRSIVDLRVWLGRHEWAGDRQAISTRLSATARSIFVWLACCVLGVGGEPGSAVASELTEPIEQLNIALLKVMRAGKTLTFQQRYEALAPAINRAFNLNFIVRSAAGARWDSLTAEQQKAIGETFQRYAVSICASHFDDYGGERFELLPEAKTGNGEPAVKVKILPGNQGDDVHVLSYTMQKNGSEWQAIDVVIDGFVSFAAVKKAELRSILWTEGAPALLARLQRLTMELSDKSGPTSQTK